MSRRGSRPTERINVEQVTLTAGDSLAGTEWDHRDWTTTTTVRERLLDRRYRLRTALMPRGTRPDSFSAECARSECARSERVEPERSCRDGGIVNLAIRPSRLFTYQSHLVGEGFTAAAFPHRPNR